jgi:hypothetical protein
VESVQYRVIPRCALSAFPRRRIRLRRSSSSSFSLPFPFSSSSLSSSPSLPTYRQQQYVRSRHSRREELEAHQPRSEPSRKGESTQVQGSVYSPSTSNRLFHIHRRAMERLTSLSSPRMTTAALGCVFLPFTFFIFPVLITRLSLPSSAPYRPPSPCHSLPDLRPSSPRQERNRFVLSCFPLFLA